jgi:hypothetical protein
MSEHDRLCPAKRYEVASSGECSWCALLARARQEAMTSAYPADKPLDLWTCGDCGNVYDIGVNYCPNGLRDRHAVILARQTGATQ